MMVEEKGRRGLTPKCSGFRGDQEAVADGSSAWPVRLFGATSRHRRPRDFLQPEATIAEPAMDLLVNIVSMTCRKPSPFTSRWRDCDSAEGSARSAWNCWAAHQSST